MNRSVALALTAIVSGAVGGAAVWFVMRPMPPIYIGIEEVGAAGPDLRAVGYRTESEEPGVRRNRSERGVLKQTDGSASAVASSTERGPEKAEQVNTSGQEEKLPWGLTVNIKRPVVVHWAPIRTGGSRRTPPLQALNGERRTKTPELLDQVLVPIPSEVFGLLRGVSRDEWAQIVKPIRKMRAPAQRYEDTALRLGVVIADGFIAVKAEKIDEVGTVARNVEYLAKELGVEKTRERQLSITTSAQKRDWQKVYRELDALVGEVREANNEAMAHLVSLGCWLRSLEALTELIAAHYTEENAELLQQSAIVEHFRNCIAGLPSGSRTGLTDDIHRALTELDAAMGSNAPTLSVSDVKTVHQTADSIVDRIVGDRRSVSGQPISLR